MTDQCVPRNCEFTQWSSWSQCSAGGIQNRTRGIKTRAQCGGTQCNQRRTETKQCSPAPPSFTCPETVTDLSSSNNNNCNGDECGTWKPSGAGEECGFRVYFTNVVGGRIAQLGSYTYMALLGFADNGRIDYRCTGSLINRRYIMTAAHCVQDIPA